MEHLEGRIAVLAALSARRRRIDVVLVAAHAHAEKAADVLEAASRAGVPVKRVETAELDRLAHGRTHGGVAAVCSGRPPDALDDLLAVLDRSTSPPFLVMLEGLEDAQNLGFTLRTAEAFGAQGVLLKKHVWDFDAADVSRSSSGAYERLPLVKVESAAPVIASLRKRGVLAWGCIAGAKRTIYDAELKGPVLLAIGGEKRGLSGAMRELCDGFVSIPMAAAATSLSLGHAAAILIGEVARQRGRQERSS